MKSAAVFFLLLLVSFSGRANDYSMNGQCRQAYQLVLNLRFTEARELLNAEKQSSPENLIVPYLENYISFLKILISEDQALFNKQETERSNTLEKLRSGDVSSPWHLYTQAQFNMQWAVVSLKLGEYPTAALQFNRAYRLLTKNQQRYPQFAPNRAALALMKIIIGSIPDNYQWVARLFSMKGSINEGICELQKISSSAEHPYLLQESLFLLTFSTFNLADAGSQLQFLKELMVKPEIAGIICESPLLIYATSVFYMHNGQNDKAIELLLKRPATDSYFPFHYLDYLTGLAKLNRLDKDAALWFLRYVNHFSGKSFIKSAYQRLAWIALMDGNVQGYTEYMERIKLRGNTQIDGDKQALSEAQQHITPNVVLLKARLLSDGGYYESANSILSSVSSNNFNTSHDKIEFTYRRARILHEWGEINEAKLFYEKTLKEGAGEKWYFAANSALNLGLIYEREKNFTQAAFYYNKCLGLDYEEYRTSISQKARAGLNRVGD